MAVTPVEFWDRIAPGYSTQPIADAESYARKLAATQALMRADMNVLEFGCGTGSTALEHAPHVAHIDATDLSPAMIAIGRQKAEDAGVANVNFQVCDVESFTAPDGSYDMVLAMNLLHLVPDRVAALAKIRRLLKPGGLFVSSTVCLGDRLWFLRPVVAVMQGIGKAPWVSFLKSAPLLREIEEAGFTPREHWSHARGSSHFVVAARR